jgi:hypothetical protein
VQEPTAVTVGRVTAQAWGGQENLAAALAELADRAPPPPGLEAWPERPITLTLAPTRGRFDSLTRRQLPDWSDGAAFPDRAWVVLRSDRPPDRLSVALRHELAHLALRWRVGRVAPLWFEEGYASVAAREWDRFDALRLNWTLARGAPPGLADVDRALRGDAGDAFGAYALATTAVLLLERWGGARGLEPLLTNAATATSFDAALRMTYAVTEGDFEARWHADLRSRYGWLAWGAAAALVWTLAAVVLLWLARRRRVRDAVRRAALEAVPPGAADDAPTP